MISSDQCRERAADFERKAERASDEEARKLYYELADIWLELADHLGALERRQIPN
jgi:hypothetical protein